MQPWEIEEAWKYAFVRDCSSLVDAIVKRALVLPGTGLQVSSTCDNPARPKFTIIFKIAEKDMPSGGWTYEGWLRSKWETDENTGKKWCLSVYLQGNISCYKKKYLRLFLRSSRGSPMSTEQQKYQLFLLNKNRNGILYSKSFDHKFEQGQSWGFRKFIEKRLVYGEGSQYMSEEPRSLTFGVNLF